MNEEKREHQGNTNLNTLIFPQCQMILNDILDDSSDVGIFFPDKTIMHGK